MMVDGKAHLRVFVTMLGCLVLGSCILTQFGVQLLELHFEYDETLVEGEDALVHQQVLPSAVTVKKQFLRVSGRISGATSLPDRLDVLIEAEDVASGRVYYRFRAKVRVGSDGKFVATGKWKKSLDAETLLSTFVTPVGSDLAGDLDVDFCVHMAKQKSTLSSVPDCRTGTFDLPPAFELEADATGWHELITVRGAFPSNLPPTSGRELVVALRDASRPNQVCPEEVPWDGCASVDWDDRNGTRNAPPGGGYFENRVVLQTASGSVEMFLNRGLGLSRELDDDFALE